MDHFTSKTDVTRVGVRLFGAVFPIACAMVIPSMASFVSLIGAVAATTLGAIIPLLMYQQAFGPGLSIWMFAIGGCMLVVTVVFGAWAVVSSLV